MRQQTTVSRHARWLVAIVALTATSCDPIWESPFTIRVPAATQAAFSARLPAYLLVKPDYGLYHDSGTLLATICAASDDVVAEWVHSDVGCASEVDVVAWLLPVPAGERGALSCGIANPRSTYQSGAVASDAPQGRGRAFRGLGNCTESDGPAEEIVVR